MLKTSDSKDGVELPRAFHFDLLEERRPRRKEYFFFL